MHNFVGVIILPCWWADECYVAVQSTARHLWLDVFLKRASTLADALWSPRDWIKQPYGMPWVDLLTPWYVDNPGVEIMLWRNDMPGERGVAVGWRYLDYPSKWIYATVIVPRMNKSRMQLTYLDWGWRFMEVAKDFYWETDETNNAWPYVYAPRGYSTEDVMDWVDTLTRMTTLMTVTERADYYKKIPFIKDVIRRYANERWL